MTDEAIDAAISAGWVRDGLADPDCDVIDHYERSAYATGRASVVPREPTQEMYQAGIETNKALGFPDDVFHLVAVWRAMWDAAPLDAASVCDWNAMARMMQRRFGASGSVPLPIVAQCQDCGLAYVSFHPTKDRPNPGCLRCGGPIKWLPTNTAPREGPP